MNEIKEKESRNASDILLSLEEKVLALTQLIVVNDMNNKLILDRLNKLLNNTSSSLPKEQTKISNKIISNNPIVEVNKNPVSTRKQTVTEPVGKKVKEKSSIKEIKIPVVQRITDGKGNDLYLADVVITNAINKELMVKLKTNATGKWQTQLPPGSYNIHISKLIDAESMNKIESLQVIEVESKMKSLQLPVAIIR